jgi:hypothetical protein
VLVVSAGDDLWGPTVPFGQRRLRARAILDGYARLGVDAMGAGEMDRVAGDGLINIKGRALVERAGIRVGVFAHDLEAEPKPEALRREAAALRKQGARLVVALLHGGMARARDALASSLPIDVAVASHSGWGVQDPERAGTTWLVEGPGQGKHFGQLDLHVVDGKLEFQDAGQRGQMEAMLVGQQQELRDLATRQAQSSKELREFYDRRKKEIEESSATLRAKIAALPAAGQGSWVENKLVPLGTEVPDEPGMAALVKRYKEDVAKLPPEPRPKPVGPSGTYLGAAECGRCHPAQLAFWKRTKHARAWATLVNHRRERDESCIRCHVTDGPSLPDVQCEACHGPGVSHANQPGIPGLVVRDVPEPTCRRCHTPEQTGEWEYASFRRAVLGPGHGRR